MSSLRGRFVLSRPLALTLMVFSAITGLLVMSGPAPAQLGVPQAAVLGAITGSPDGQTALEDFLMEGSPPPATVVARARLAIGALKVNSLGLDAAQLVGAAQRIAEAAQPGICPIKVMRLQMPDVAALPSDVAAYDFGTHDGPVMPCCEPVRPDDSRLSSGGQGVFRPDGNALLSDGIRGVRQFQTETTPGPKRVAIITEDLGEEATTLEPVGRVIVINGVRYRLGEQPPQAWVDSAVLQSEGQGGGLGGALGNLLGGDVSVRDTGAGVVILEADIEGTILSIGFETSEGDRQTFIAGIVVEPADRPSIFQRSGIAESAVPSLSQCLSFEAEIELAVAELVSEIETAAGDADTPPVEPVADDGLRASPIS